MATGATSAAGTANAATTGEAMVAMAAAMRGAGMAGECAGPALMSQKLVSSGQADVVLVGHVLHLVANTGRRSIKRIISLLVVQCVLCSLLSQQLSQWLTPCNCVVAVQVW